MERPLGDRYSIGEPIGGGGTGEVFRGQDRNGVPVAIKVVRPELAGGPGVVARFVQGRPVLLRLADPHLVTVRDLVVEGPTLAVVTDLVPGADLRRGLRGVRTLPPAEAARLGAGVASGLAALHAAGVVHGDVKPENVMLDAGQMPPRVRLTDFGLTGIFSDATRTTTGSRGTPVYKAPEVLAGAPGSPAGDLYALGMMLYELCCGVTAFDGGGSAATVTRDQTMTVPGKPDGMPDPMWDLISRLLEQDPERRPSDAAGVAAALSDLTSRLQGVPAARALSAQPAGTPPPAPAPPPPAPAPPRRRRAGALLMVGGVVLAAMVAAGTRFFAADQTPAEQTARSVDAEATPSPTRAAAPAEDRPPARPGVGTPAPPNATDDISPGRPICRPSAGAPTSKDSTWLTTALAGQCREDVRQVQQWLNAFGLSVVVNGHYGEQTEEAVLRFQRQRCITADGKVGPATWRALTSPYTNCRGEDVEGTDSDD